MSAVLDYLKRRRTYRRPFDEALPDGTPAAEVLTPRTLRLPANFPRGAQVQPIEEALGGGALGAPAHQLFTEGTPTPVLEAPTPLRSFAFTPEVEGMPSEPLAPIPPEARRRLTRPTLQNTGDQPGDLQRYEQNLSEWKNPEDRNGRLKSFGLGALRGLMRGLATGQGLGAGLGGAIAGGVHGGVSPNLDEREWRDEEIARTQQQQGALQGRRLAGLKLRGMEADVLKTEAERDALLNPKPKEITPHYETRDDGTYVRDAQNPEGRKLAGIPGKPSPEKARQREWIDDGQGNEVLHQYDEAGVPQMVLRGEQPVTRPGRQFVEAPLSTGGTARIPATEVYRGDRATEAANTTLGNQYGNQTFEDTVRQQERQHTQTVAQWEAAGREQQRLVKALSDAREAAAKRDSAAREAADPTLKEEERQKAERDRVYWNEQVRAHKATVGNVASSISQAYGDFVETDAEGWPTRLKPRPAAPSLPSRPAPQRRSVGASPRQSAPKRQGADPLGLFK